MELNDTPPGAAAWLSPAADWPAGVRAVFTTRQGGCSAAPYDSLNLGSHVGDEAERVSRNRQLLAAEAGVRPVFLNQVHGTEVVQLTPDTPDGVTADACWTDAPGLACTVMVADCLPLLFAAPDGSSVAAVHAGWRGLAGQGQPGGQGVIEALCRHWPAAASAAQRRALRVWLGPCIGPQVFEVGAEVRAAFLATDPAAANCFVALRAEGKFLANLPALARRRLMALGMEQVTGNDGSAPWCTVAQASRFFSHRRDAGRFGSTGRMAGLIWRGGA
ncbi:MAG TPA: peptidoglycan editing factor PgeF [Macromonas sp.]|nr:peptidoglycan editing factor PgeF [Macromonas sp.]